MAWQWARSVLVVALAATVSGGCAVDMSRKTTLAPAVAESAPAVSDGAFIHLHSGPDDPHRVLMGLQMATMMSADKDVLVYCDIDAVGLVVVGGPDLSMEPFGSSQAMIANLVAKGVPVYACPGCLKKAGLAPERLLPGVKVADRNAFFGFTRGRILTLDY